MTVINPNSISGVASVTAQGDIIQFYKSDGTLGAVQFDGANFNTTSGVSTFNNLYVGGVLTYEDVKNVDAIGIVTAREGIFLPDSKKLQLGNAAGSSDLEIYHDSNHNNIKCVNGNLRIWSNSSSEAISCVAGAQVTLSHGNTVRLSTTGSGIDVTGTGTFSSTVSVNSGNLDINDSIRHIGDTDTNIRFPAADTVTIETGGDERLRIDSAGRVGVGTITPHSSYRFDIRHTSDSILHLGQNNNTLTGMVNNSWNVLSFQGTNCELGLYKDSSGDFSYIMGTYQGSVNIPLVFRTGNRVERLRIKSDGDVGIGTDSPSYRLQVHDSDGALFRVLTGHESTYDLRFVYQNSETNIWSYGSTDLTFGTRYNKKLHLVTNGPGKRLTIDGSGLVGIGDDSPTVSLSLKRNQTSNHYVRVENTNSSSTYVGLSLKTPTLDCQIWNQGPGGSGYGGANSMNFYQAGTYGAFAFYHGTDERFRIESDGDFRFSSGNAGSNYGWIRGWQSSTGDMIISADHSATGSGTSKSNLIFKSRGSEKMRITSNASDALLLLGTDDTGFSSGYTTMTIGNASTQNTGLTIASSSSNGYSRIHFADGNSGAAKYAGWIAYDHSTDAFVMATGNSGSATLRYNSNGNLQFGGLVSGGNYQSGNARNLIDFGSGTLNRGFGWGGTNANYTNIWTEYSTGALHLGMGIRPTGNSTGWVSSYGGGAIGRSALKMDLNGAITIFTGDNSQIAVGGATNLTQKWYLHRTGQITHQFAGRYGTVMGSTDGSGAYILLDGEAGGTLASGSDYMYMEHTSSGMFEMWNGKTGVQTTKFMDVHPEGYMRLPKKPLWDGDGFNTGSAPPAVQTNIIPLRATRVNVNQGGHFDNATGIFTCPVQGYYQLHGYVNQRASYNLWIGIYVTLNGVTMSSTWWPPITANSTALTASHFTYMPLGIQHTFYCAANDELALCYHQSYSAPSNANDVSWHIELIS